MNFIQSIKTCFRKYANFKGRAMRSEYWWFQLFNTVLGLGTMALDHLLLGYTFEDTVTPLATIGTIAMIIPSASVGARRLHDIGWSGWVQLPVFLVYVSYLDIWSPGFSLSSAGLSLIFASMFFGVLLYIILIKDSQSKTNKYGPNPKAPEMDKVFS